MKITPFVDWLYPKLRAEWEQSLHENFSANEELVQRPLTHEETRDVGILVNSDQYPAFRELLKRLAVGHYVDSRRFQDEKTHAYNRIGQLLLEVVAALDSYRVKQEVPLEEDEYDM